MQNGMKWLKQSPIIFLSLYSMRTTNICAAYSAWAISESLVSLLKADNFNQFGSSGTARNDMITLKIN